MKLNLAQLEKKSREIRKTIIKSCWRAQASHLGSALSVVDILTVLFFNVANINPRKITYSSRDRIILSKGHGGIALLATMAHRGYLPIKALTKYCSDGSTLLGHPMIESIPGVEATTGSLGHGLSIGVGMALAARYDRRGCKIYVVLSDGEMDEGSTWEAVMAAGHLGLDNLVAIVDYNKIQSFGTVREVMDLEPLASKWRAFKWNVREIDGHNFKELVEALRATPISRGKPSAIIAHTVKGKGVSFMEDKLEWHYKSPNRQELALALKELS